MSKDKSTKTTPSVLLVFILFFLIIITASIFGLYKNYYNTTWQSAHFAETPAELSNPYRGWYQIYGYLLSDGSDYTRESILNSCAYDIDSRLALLEINLKNYRTGVISDSAMRQLELILSTWSLTDKKLILRFLYDWDGKAIETEPDDISIITGHMSQIASVINAYSDAIYTLQGIFVGNTGEMNNSKYMSYESMTILIKRLAEVTKPEIYLSVRTPAHWRQITSSFEPLSTIEAFSGTLSSRIGLYNDGMLGSEYDYGTYGDLPLARATRYSDKGQRSDELTFQNQLCLFVPNGGEAIVDNPYNDLAKAIPDLYRMHVSYLNSMYDPAVLNKWRSSIYQGSDVFAGCSGYEYISRHLGYRYVLRSTSLSFHTFRDKYATLTIDIDNIGFANSYKEFQVFLKIRHRETGELREVLVDTDTRTWLSQELTQITVPLDIRSYATGAYELSLSMSDPVSQQEILFANTDREPSFGYSLGSLSVSKHP